MTAATFAFAQLLRVLPRTRITRAVGRLCDLQLPESVSRAVVGAYVRAYRVDLAEAEPLVGRTAYKSFDAFFTRRLRDGARTIEAPAEVLVSPSDGRLDSVGEVDRNGLLEVKGRGYRAADLLGDSHDGDSAAERYLGGQFAIIYLSPRDYHRVHAPTDGELVAVRSYAGELFPVNGISEAHIPNYLGRNRRVAMQLHSETLGDVTVVMVAAMIVGRISVTAIDARDVPVGVHPVSGIHLTRGDELGIFHLGSTAVIFLEPGAPRIDRALGPVRLGQPMIACPEAAPGGNGHG